MPDPIEITATYRNERIRFENGDADVVVIDADYVNGNRPGDCPNRFALKGPDCDFEYSHTYRFFGRWSTYKNRRTGEEERQFHFQSAVESTPASRAGVISYIQSAGKGNGIGRVTATKIWEKYGPQAVAILREQPERVAREIRGLSVDHAILTAEVLAAKQHIEACSIELMELLNRRGFPRNTAKRCLDRWGNRAAEMIRRNPYLLMAFRGCGFKKCDAMYLDLGLPPDKLKRQALCAWYKLASDTIGHTWFPRDFAVRGIRENVSIQRVRPDRALELARRAGMISERTHDGREWVAERKAARAEQYVADCIVDALDEQR